MSTQAVGGSSPEPRPATKPARCIRYVIDIASPEELWDHDGPLLAEDLDYDDAAAEHILPKAPAQHKAHKVNDRVQQEQGIEQHVKKVMEQIKARQQEEVLQRFDYAMYAAAHRVDLLDLVELPLEAHEAEEEICSSVWPSAEEGSSVWPSAEEQQLLTMHTMSEPQVDQERLELEIQTRAIAALQAAAERAATSTTAKASESASRAEDKVKEISVASSSKTAPAKARPKDSNDLQTRIQKALEAAQSRHASEQPSRVPPEKKKPSHVPAAPAPARAAKAATTVQPKAPETLQDRINRVMVEAQRRSTTVQDTNSPHAGENLEEQTTTASSYSATDSGSDSGTEWPSLSRWGNAPPKAAAQWGTEWGPAPR